jgi:hypothetical protein
MSDDHVTPELIYEEWAHRCFEQRIARFEHHVRENRSHSSSVKNVGKAK